jgi:hypothetical protein
MSASSRRAVLIGLNRFDAKGTLLLNGCVQDVLDMQQVVVERFGMDNPNYRRMLVDESATKQAEMERLLWLVNDLNQGDVLLFHKSSHGTQTVNISYDDPGDVESDGLDEATVPYGAKDWRADLMLDDDYAHIFKAVPPGVNLTVIFDLCHSGTGLREDLNPLIFPTPSPNRIRGIPPPVDIINRAITGKGNPVKRRKLAKAMGNTSINTGILLAACGSNQTAADAFLQPRYNGAFTYYLLKTLREANFDIDYETLVSKTGRALKENNFAQTPELNCAPALRKARFLQPINTI